MILKNGLFLLFLLYHASKMPDFLGSKHHISIKSLIIEFKKSWFQKALASLWCPRADPNVGILTQVTAKLHNDYPILQNEDA